METSYRQKKRSQVALICAKLSDEELDMFYDNPGVAKYVRAFAEGKTIQVLVNGEIFEAKSPFFFDGPPVSSRPWRIISVESSNNKEWE